MKTGGNLEELLYDIENLSKDIMELQIHCADMPGEEKTVTVMNPKPFRSELNLVLSYPNETESVHDDDDDEAQLKSGIDATQNVLLYQNLPSPFPTFPSSPLTPPINFKPDYQIGFVPERLQDLSHLNFTPLNTSAATFSSNSSIFCTVSAPSTPAVERKCIDKFCSNEESADGRNVGDKKKSKRVSIFNESKNESATAPPNEEPQVGDIKDADKKNQGDVSSTSNNNHHSHVHKNHSHSHLHSHPKRRMSLDNTTVNKPQLLSIHSSIHYT